MKNAHLLESRKHEGKIDLVQLKPDRRFAIQAFRERPSADVEFKRQAQLMNNHLYMESLSDSFISSGKMEPGKWIEDRR